MNKREKIIIVIAILVLSYGAFDYFILSSDKNEKNETIQSETANQVSKMLEKINKNLISLEIIEQKKTNADYLISRIESEWKNDPFSKSDKFSGKSQKPAPSTEISAFTYSGFIKLGNKMLAVIDGMEYTTGEYIKDSEYKIIRITPQKVVINTNMNTQIVIYLKDGQS